MVVLSPSAKDSVWVDRELEYANHYGIPIFPILAGGEIKEAIPFELASHQFVDVRGNFNKAMQPLVTRLCNHLGIKDTSNRITMPLNNKRGRLVRVFVGIIALILVVVGLILFMPELPRQNVAAAPEIPPDVVLTYDSESFTLRAESQVDLAQVSFVQAGRVFQATEWQAVTLDEADCVQIWQIETGYLSPPPECRARQAYRVISERRVFWVDSAFDVRLDGQTVTTCSPSDSPREIALRP